MPYLSQITHPSELAQSKVNFFADYFQYASNQMGYFDGFEIENFRSLVEKIIYQVSQNLERCPQYLDSYLSHPLLQADNKYFKEFRSYHSVKNNFAKYLSAEKPGRKIKWIKSTPGFLKSLNKFENELRRTLFKRALYSIISYLRCIHDIAHHKDDIIHYTNIMVSEFLLNGWAKSDIENVFDKIITREIKDFPFSKSFLKQNKENNLEEAKNEFIKKRSFKQQFEGIYNLFKQSHSKHFYLFRIYNISVSNNFSFKYNKVTFYHCRHEKLKELITRSQEDVFMKNFFSNEEMLIAAVKVKYYSSKIAETDAIKLISSELPFLNKICESNAYLERHSYMITSNFKTFGSHWSRDERAHSISESEQEQLVDNPYRFLSKISLSVKNHLLKQEPLFITAINSNDISDYWHYLETLIKPSHEEVIETTSTILLLNAVEFHENSLMNYILSNVSHFSYPEALIGLTKERQQYYYGQLSSQGELNFKQLLSELKHPFINHLSKIYSSSLTKDDFKKAKQHYKRILVETYAQRNAVIHKGEANEKSLILLYHSIPRLIMRFRWLVFGEMKKKTAKSFAEILDNLKGEGQKLI